MDTYKNEELLTPFGLGQVIEEAGKEENYHNIDNDLPIIDKEYLDMLSAKFIALTETTNMYPLLREIDVDLSCVIEPIDSIFEEMHFDDPHLHPIKWLLGNLTTPDTPIVACSLRILLRLITFSSYPFLFFEPIDAKNILKLQRSPDCRDYVFAILFFAMDNIPEISFVLISQFNAIDEILGSLRSFSDPLIIGYGFLFIYELMKHTDFSKLDFGKVLDIQTKLNLFIQRYADSSLYYLANALVYKRRKLDENFENVVEDSSFQSSNERNMIHVMNPIIVMPILQILSILVDIWIVDDNQSLEMLLTPSVVNLLLTITNQSIVFSSNKVLYSFALKIWNQVFIKMNKDFLSKDFAPDLLKSIVAPLNNERYPITKILFLISNFCYFTDCALLILEQPSFLEIASISNNLDFYQKENFYFIILNSMCCAIDTIIAAEYFPETCPDLYYAIESAISDDYKLLFLYALQSFLQFKGISAIEYFEPDELKETLEDLSNCENQNVSIEATNILIVYFDD